MEDRLKRSKEARKLTSQQLHSTSSKLFAENMLRCCRVEAGATLRALPFCSTQVGPFLMALTIEAFIDGSISASSGAGLRWRRRCIAALHLAKPQEQEPGNFAKRLVFPETREQLLSNQTSP